MIKPEDLEKQVKAGEINHIYLLFGEEQYLQESIIKKIKKQFGEIVPGINFIQLDETNVHNLIPEIEVPAFGYEKKLIIIKDTSLFKKETKKKNDKLQELSIKIKEYLEQNIDMVKDTCIIVFAQEEADKNELFNFIEKEGIICNFEKLKPVELIRRLKPICNAYKVNVSEKTLEYFVQSIGTNMQDAINEIRKLIEYAGEGGTIKDEDIDELCIKQTEAVIFDLTDYLGSKNAKSALETLHNLEYNKEPVQKILMLVYNHFKKLYYTKICERLNKDISSSLELKPNQKFLVSKYKKQANYFSENMLRSILQELTDLDANYKIGLIDIDIGLESILCNYCSL